MIKNIRTESIANQVNERRLWSSWFVAIVAWALHIFLSYSFVEWYCQNTEALSLTFSKLILHSWTAMCFLIALTSSVRSWLLFKKEKNRMVNGKASARRFICQGGVILGGFLAIVIVVQGIPNGILKLC